jgi:tetratricopeptide (TPR) repeat protein
VTVDIVTALKLTWLANKLRGLLSRGKKAEIHERTLKIHFTSGKFITYHERIISVSLEQEQTAFVDGGLEQIQTSSRIKAALEKAGVPQLTREQVATESTADSVRQRAEKLPAVERDLVGVSVLLGHGDVRFHADDFAGAEHAYRRAYEMARAIGDKSMQGVCLTVLGAALGKQMRYQEALGCFKEATELSPNSAAAWGGKGASLLALEQYKQALASFDEATKLEPSIAGIWALKGFVLKNLGGDEKALACFDEATKLKPDFLDAWKLKGGLLFVLVRYEEALSCFEKATKLSPNFVEAWIDKGLSLLMLDRYEQSLECFDEAAKLEPGKAEAWTCRSLALDSLHRDEEALASIEKAIELNPGFAWVWQWKALVLRGLGRDEEASVAYKRARELGIDKQ